MIRSFLPVGQGAFYTEQFECGVNVVYDCGSSTSKSCVEKQIRSVFEPQEKIQAVFISHFHEDHMNGLPFLLSYCNVERIYLPYLTEDEILLTRLLNRLENAESPFLLGMLEDPLHEIQNCTEKNNTITSELFYVLPVDTHMRPDIPFSSISSGEPVLLFASESEQKHKKGWIYVPYNFQNTRRSSLFFKGLKKNGYDKKTLASYLETSDIFSYDWDDIKRIYQKYAPGSLNSNSLVVYSGFSCKSDRFLKPSGFFMPELSIPQSGCMKTYENGCLYMGDYDAGTKENWKNMTDHLSEYISLIGTVQVPHHGSKHNYNEELACGQFLLIISAGYQNKYKHPHAYVLKDLLAKKILHFWITEHSGSMVQFRIEE